MATRWAADDGGSTGSGSGAGWTRQVRAALARVVAAPAAWMGYGRGPLVSVSVDPVAVVPLAAVPASAAVRRMAAVSLALAQLLAVRPVAAATPAASLEAAVVAADAVVLVLVADPSTHQQRVPRTGDPPFVRRRWHLQVVEVLKGKGLRPNAVLLVDEAGWRQDLAAHQACQRRRQQPCPLPDHPAYASQLAREPRTGDTVLALLRRDGQGWQMAFENGFDASSQGDQARRVLAAKERR